MADYIAKRCHDGWAIIKHDTSPMLIPVGCLIPGSVQYGRDDQPGAFCTRPNIRDDELVDHHYQELLGRYESRAHAERMITAIVAGE